MVKLQVTFAGIGTAGGTSFRNGSRAAVQLIVAAISGYFSNN